MSTEMLLAVVLIILAAAAVTYYCIGRKSRTDGSRQGAPFEHVDPKVELSSLKPEAGQQDAGDRKTEPGVKRSEPEAGAEPPAEPSLPEPAASGEESLTEQPDIDQMTEVVVRLSCKAPFSSNQALLASQPLRSQDFDVPLRIQVKNQFTKLWGPIQRGSNTYTDMIIALQLATRRGQVDELAAGNFAAAVNQAVGTLDADADVVDVPSIVAQAKSVKALIDRYSMRLSIGVKGPLPVSQQMAMDIARGCGFDIRGKSVEKRDRDSGAPWLRMLPHPQVPNMVVFELMPALCTPSCNPLGALFGVANDAAARLSGEITDASGRPLSVPQIVEISRQLRFFYAAMAKQGLDAGTRRAKRLFS
ncbi:hypothetical protein MUN46_007005 [Mesosutterella sp. AGMB02718]|uniref:Cell division protein ZipA n=1 Tax=Mesosutterella faecium TaxID=2925194 RepID=A0ABT7IMS1_9BURK|nr:hypothetical protein [Mesosutterella sp. AGMB02718]MDL2059675.1 hypothetical protein [Mesosutterella sp. AGMB02718]